MHFDFDRIGQFSDRHSARSSPERVSQQSSTSSCSHKYDATAATFLDVAVLRCLFIQHWQEDGVYWCLHYLYNRLRKISEEVSVPVLQTRRRSNSLPIPQIEISLYQGTNSNSRDSPSGNTLKDFIEVPDQAVPTISSGKSLAVDFEVSSRPILIHTTFHFRCQRQLGIERSTNSGHRNNRAPCKQRAQAKC